MFASFGFAGSTPGPPGPSGGAGSWEDRLPGVDEGEDDLLDDEDLLAGGVADMFAADGEE